MELRGGGRRESGAFLLGKSEDARRTVSHYLLHDDLEQSALDTGIIGLTSVGFRKLAEEARSLGLDVVADIHTHPREAFFSLTDRQNPMVPRVGHLAFVVPNYATGNPSVEECAMYRYAGNHEWDDLATSGRDRHVYVGYWS